MGSIDSLKRQLLLSKEDTNKVMLLDDISYAYTWSYPDTSVQYAQQALALAKELDYDFGIAISYNGLCRAFTTVGNFPLALDCGFKALALYQRLNNTSYIIGLYGDIGLCYREQGDYINGIKYGHKSVELALANHADILQLTGMQGMLSSIYQKNHQPDSAIKYAEAAYKVQKQWSGLFPVLGSAYAQKGNYAKALEFYRKGIPIAQEQHLPIDLIDIYNGLSEIYQSQGRTDSAIYYATKGVQQEQSRVYPASLMHTTAMLANLYETEHKTDSALKYYQLTLALKDSFFSQEKARAVQNVAFNEQQRLQQLALTQQQYRSKIRTYGLIGGLIAVLVIAGLLWRNNRHKQRAYALLQQQKAKTDKQREKAEQTLQELKTTQAQLVQREKMASLGELMAGIAHEIQNPLNFINNFSEINKDLIGELDQANDNGNPAEVKAIAADIKENEQKIAHHGHRADAIVKGMLQHSRASTGKKELTDINALCGEYLRLSYQAVRSKDKVLNIDLKTNFDTSIGKVNIIPQDMGRVLLNLFNNAFYSVQKKQQQLKDSYEPAVFVGTEKIGNKVLVRIEDNGIGIPENLLSKIFQPFFTTKPTGEGTGLGLSLSYDMVTKGHGGELKVESKEEGAAFIIELPVG